MNEIIKKKQQTPKLLAMQLNSNHGSTFKGVFIWECSVATVNKNLRKHKFKSSSFASAIPSSECNSAYGEKFLHKDSY